MKSVKFQVCMAVALFAAIAVETSCSSAPHKPKVYTVKIENMKFMPDTITVEEGDTVQWVNKDMVAHDVTEQSSGAWASGPLLSDSTWKMAVKDDADYYCSIHAVMKGKILLK
jgi:plastocyanin